ncbi:hypothetical protein PA905_31950 [Planktothrix agardhii CCAP 1459/11A]|uniref:Band 7 domain-containing protein n=1 Tax=Planktothrix agardhii CCAP 1459/11A TaxID=282420 RepID=A0A4P5ZIQ6_PLAAG|nr:hypothetical protein [Planktothrix agardhii]GDZ95014.1 hypothetical protein PA905_31950 [Planktothrix agardhii CCAP 1459/11A]
MTATYNPIISTEELRLSLFQKRPLPDAQTTIVLSGEGMELLTIEQGQRGITAGEMIWRKYHTLYKVDITEHPLSFECTLPCSTDAFDFHAKINFRCAVRDAAMIVQRNVTDVLAILQPTITDVMRNISRDYEVENSGMAERKITDRVRQEVYDEGFRSDRFVVTLSLEKEARDRIRKIKSIKEDTKIETTTIQSQIELGKQQQELIRQQQQYQMEMEMERHKLELKREEMEIERVEMRMKFYDPLIQSGSWKLLALQLANNPRDTELVLGLITQQQQIERSHQVNMLQLLLKEDAIEGTQVAEIGKRFLQSLTGTSGSILPALESSGGNESTSPKAQDGMGGKTDSSMKNDLTFNKDELT